MDRKEKIAIIIDSLQPNMGEYADNAKFHYWMEYACKLDELTILGYQDDKSVIVEHMNTVLKEKLELTPEHHACVDVASTLESQMDEFKGVFTYV